MKISRNNKVLIVLLFFILLGTASPAFSQQTLASFGVGGQFMDHDDNLAEGVMMGANVLFIGKIGLTISLGAETVFDTGIKGGVVVDPIFGIGYVHYDVIYFGAVLYGIIRPSMKYNYSYDSSGNKNIDIHATGDGFIAPTIVAGIDFDSFLLNAQVSYMKGVMSGINGFRFSIGVGVNVGNFR